MTFQGSVRAHGDAAVLRVMIVDDSIVARTVFQRMLDDAPDFSVVAVAGGADQALTLLAKITADVILLDVEMPGMDGLTALPAILAAGRGAHVVIVSSACAEGAVATLHALALGASDTLLKPSTGDMASGFADRLAERLRRLGPARRVAPVAIASAATLPIQRRDPIGCIAIGASTGGLLALADLFEGFDGFEGQCDAPILMTQHLPAEFMPYFADQLSEMARRQATVAQPGQPLLPGEILVASGAAHLSLAYDAGAVRVLYDHKPAVSACLPSVDPMLDAVASVYKASGVGIVLSGMGRDGAIGATRLAKAGGEILAQDAATATVWGMPGAVVRAGVATAVLSPASIGRRIAARMCAARTRPTIMDAAAWK